MGELLAFFTDRQAADLAGISRNQLRYWRSTAVFIPEYEADEDELGALNSFKDLVALRTLGMLRERVPLQELRKIGTWLHERYDSPWSSLRFAVVGDEIRFEDPDTGVHYSAHPLGQKLLRFELQAIVDDVTRAVHRLFARRPEDVGQIDEKGRIQGTRVPAATIQSFAREGLGDEDIQREYPHLELRDIRAAIEHTTVPARVRVGKG